MNLVNFYSLSAQCASYELTCSPFHVSMNILFAVDMIGSAIPSNCIYNEYKLYLFRNFVGHFIKSRLIKVY